MFQRPERLLLIAAIALLLMACQFGARGTTPPAATVDARALTARASTVGPSPTFPATYTATVPPTNTVVRRATATAIPSPTATLPPSPTPTPEMPDEGPLPAVWRALDWDLGRGEGAYPRSIALDPASGLAYVLSRCGLTSETESGTPSTCLSAFDLETEQVAWQGTLPNGYEGRLLLAGDTLYVHRPWVGDLYALDLPLFDEAGRYGALIEARETLSDVLAIAFDGEETTYALTETAMARLSPDRDSVPLDEEDRSRTDSPVAMAATGERIYLLGYETLRIFDRELSLIETIDLQEERPRDLALDAERGQLYIGGGTGLYVLETATNTLIQAEAAVGAIEQLLLDPSGRSLFARTILPTWFGGTEVLQIDILPGLGRTSWPVRPLYSTLSGYIPDLAVDDARERLLIVDHDDHALMPIDLASGRVDPRLPLSIEIQEVIVEAPDTLSEGSRLYVSDSSGWIHVLDRQSYEEVGRLYGGQHISLDAAHGWLYAGDPRLPVVTVFDTASLRPERIIRQAGQPRANPVTGQVVIVNRRFYLFDGATGRSEGELLTGIGRPSEECPGCYYTIATGVTIDAQRGLTMTITYTPWPGKPGPSESVDYDPRTGRAYYSLLTGGYVHYSSVATYADLGQLQQREPPVLSLEGLSGYIALDASARRLYVTRNQILFILDSETLNRVGRVQVEGWQPRVAAVDGALGRFYTPRGSQLVVWTRSGGAPPDPAPAEPVATVEEAGDRVGERIAGLLASPNFAEDRTLLATIDGRLCRSTDGGATWLQLRGGLPVFDVPSYGVYVAFSPDYAKDTAMFAGSVLGETHGEGVYCSADGGDTWQMCSNGLYALRVTRVEPSPFYARDHTLLAYARTPQGEALYRSTNGGKSWQLVVQQTGFGTPPLPRLAELFYITDPPPQFQCDFEGTCQRSDDGGATWTPFDTDPVDLSWLVTYALSPHFTEDGMVYFLTQNHLYRYEEGPGTWSTCTLPIFGGRDYTKHFTTLAVAVDEETPDAEGTPDARETPSADEASAAGDAPGATTLFLGSAAGEFYAYAAAELPWEEVVPPPTPPAPTPTPTPCAMVVDERFQIEAARLPADLGCATGAGVQTPSAEQLFERGRMFWLEEGRGIYVLRQEGTWATFEDTWDEEQPDRDPDLIPPEGLYQPLRGFGKVWREVLGGPDARVGWATAAEYPAQALVQPFANGLLLQGEGATTYALYDNGTWSAIP